MPSRVELKKISNTRLKEVKVLYRNRLYDGARYLSGYVIETALKARICKILDDDYPEKNDNIARVYHTHNFDVLVKLGGLKKKLDNELSTNANFKTNWALVTGRPEIYRYRPIGTSSQSDVQDIINALEDNKDGVLTWIKKRW